MLEKKVMFSAAPLDGFELEQEQEPVQVEYVNEELSVSEIVLDAFDFEDEPAGLGLSSFSTATATATATESEEAGVSLEENAVVGLIQKLGISLNF